MYAVGLRASTISQKVRSYDLLYIFSLYKKCEQNLKISPPEFNFIATKSLSFEGQALAQ